MATETTGWMPIKSAPKDGTSIILLVDDIVCEGFYYPELNCFLLGWPKEEFLLNAPPPTHWMPKPKVTHD